MKLSLRLQKQHKVLQLTKETCCMEDLGKDQGETQENTDEVMLLSNENDDEVNMEECELGQEDG